jgi:hypothetical protein
MIKQIVRNEPDTPTWNDVDVWLAVIELISRTTPVTLPTVFGKAVFDTPLRSSSASQKGVEQTHNEVDQRILQELRGRVHENVGRFYERYFEGKERSNKVGYIYKELMVQYVGGRWSNWPEPSL